MSQGQILPARLCVRQAKTKISLCIPTVRSGPSQGTLWVDKDPKRLQADSEDFDQTVRLRRLILVFPWADLNLLLAHVIL